MSETIDTEIQPLVRVRTVGPYEEWLARPSSKKLPELLVARRAHPARDDQQSLNGRLVASGAIARRVEHQAVLHCFGVAHTEKATYQLIEILDGIDLERWMKAIPAASPMPPPVCVWIALQVCEALAHAHSLGVVHGALSPNQILISRQGHIKLDFGLAADLASSTLTDWVDVRYLNPKGGEDLQVDLYATAAILWSLLTGRPYRLALDLSATGRAYTPAKPIRDAVVKELDDCLQRALDIDSVSPYESARTFADALTRVFYGFMDADEERDGRLRAIEWIDQSAPEEDELLNRYRPTVTGTEEAPKVKLAEQDGLFSAAVAERDEPVRPSPISTEDVRLESHPLSADSTWSPGQELAGGLKQPAAVSGFEELLATRSEQKTEWVQSAPEHPISDHLTSDPEHLIGQLEEIREAESEPKLVTSKSNEAPLAPNLPSAPSKLLWFWAGFAVTLSLLLLHGAMT